jgi:hypothetical protein
MKSLEPAGHIIGWEHISIHEHTHFLSRIVNNTAIDSAGATFRDGYRTVVIFDAIHESATT